jgi:hypothetical protein
MRRKVPVTIAAAASLVFVGGVAYAAIPGTDGIIQGCYDSGGNVKVVTALPCPKGYTPFQWNQQGPKGEPGAAGANGASPTVAQLQPGDSSCPAGGAAITAADGSTAFVCNGTDGTNGQSFTGTFTSPNGQHSINVTDAGIVLSSGPRTSVALVGDDLVLRTKGRFDLRSDLSIGLKAGTSANFEAQDVLTLRGSQVNVN